MSPGSLSGNATEIFQEGLRMPPIKMVDRGIVNEVALEILLSNDRLSRKSHGDFRAMLGTCVLGETKLQSLAEKFGTRELLAGSRELIAGADRRMRRAISATADGTYEYEFHLENGGASPEPVRARIALTVFGDRISVDFAGSSPTVRGPINLGPAMAPMMVFTCLKALLDPSGPINAGAFNPIEVSLPDGSYLKATSPTACGGMAEAVMSIASVMIGVVASIWPDRAVGDIKGAGNNLYIGGKSPSTADPFVCYEFPAGGTGAFRGGDGNNVCRHFLEGDFGSMQPIEVIESEFPLLVERSSLRVDSGGPGEWRGGLGLDRRIRVLTDNASLSYIVDKLSTGPFGVCGGDAGAPNGVGVIRRGVQFDPGALPGKATAVRLERDDVVFSKCAGGGGYGDPLERDLAAVAHDVEMGYISEIGALHDYGVVLRGGIPDRTATHRSRAKLRGARHFVTLVGSSFRIDSAARHGCLAAEETLVDLGVESGGIIEFVNPSGAPIRLWIEASGNIETGTVVVDAWVARVIGVQNSDAKVWVRVPRLWMDANQPV
jgi:N-methylhydantoinase B